MQSLQELQDGLKQFTGEVVWYQPLLYPHFLYTKGVRYLAVNADCFWLLDFIFSNQVLPTISEVIYQVWTIEQADNQATITVRDRNETVIEVFTLSNSCFPLKEYTLWCIQGRLLLASEY
ncbi:MAG: DUF6876 family protein [Bacteroidota bacterium]